MRFVCHLLWSSQGYRQLMWNCFRQRRAQKDFEKLSESEYIKCLRLREIALLIVASGVGVHRGSKRTMMTNIQRDYIRYKTVENLPRPRHIWRTRFSISKKTFLAGFIGDVFRPHLANPRSCFSFLRSSLDTGSGCWGQANFRSVIRMCALPYRCAIGYAYWPWCCVCT